MNLRSIMKRAHKNSFVLSIFFSLFFAGMLLAGCSDNRTGPTPPDFSTVPDPYDTTEAKEKKELDNGLVYYIFKEGSGPFEVVARDQIEIYYTARIQSTGDVFDSSYKNGSTEPSIFTVSSAIKGFRQGVIGMKIGGKRKIIIPPELGYQSEDHRLHGKTLIYDVKLADILGD
jgi:peptidylprolyl isomerase